MALGRRVLASNPQVNVFHRGFTACDSYANGLQAVAEVTCPILFLLGATDQMTTPKAAQSLIEQARLCDKNYRVVNVPMGHHQMSESRRDFVSVERVFELRLKRALERHSTSRNNKACQRRQSPALSELCTSNKRCMSGIKGVWSGSASNT